MLKVLPEGPKSPPGTTEECAKCGEVVESEKNLRGNIQWGSRYVERGALGGGNQEEKEPRGR